MGKKGLKRNADGFLEKKTSSKEEEMKIDEKGRIVQYFTDATPFAILQMYGSAVVSDRDTPDTFSIQTFS